MEDPFLTLNGLIKWKIDSCEKNEIKTLLENVLKDNLNQLDLICNQLTKAIYRKFLCLKLNFSKEIEKFVEYNEKLYSKIDQLREEFLKFSTEWFKELEINNFDQVLNGINIIIEKYNSNNENINYFRRQLKALPTIKTQGIYNINIENHALNNLNWSHFSDKSFSNTIKLKK